MLAVAALVSCSNEEVLEVDKGEAIAFGDAFVDNATRATDPSLGTTAKPLTTFNVWGTVKGNSNLVAIFANNIVTGSVGEGSTWECTNTTQYWITGAKYNFAALVNASEVELGSDLLPATVVFESDGSTDLLYAKSIEYTGQASGNPKVAFTFEHLLSKVKFTFDKATYNNARYTYRITGIQFTNPYKQGVYNIANKTWGSQTIRTSAIDFGAGEAVITKTTLSVESNYARMLVPATYTDLGVTFTIETLLDGKSLGTKTINETLAQTFEKGKAYNVVVALGENNLITFTVDELTGWDSETNISIP